jgi:hypothetical protein
MRNRLRRYGFRETQIESMVKEEQQKKAGVIERWEPKAPTYIKISSEYLLPETLAYYDIPFEYDRVGLPLLTCSMLWHRIKANLEFLQQTDPSYFLILQELSKHQTDVLFEHTKRLRQGKLLIEAPKKNSPQYAWYRKRDRSSSRVRKLGILEYKT